MIKKLESLFNKEVVKIHCFDQIKDTDTHVNKLLKVVFQPLNNQTFSNEIITGLVGKKVICPYTNKKVTISKAAKSESSESILAYTIEPKTITGFASDEDEVEPKVDNDDF